MDYEKQKKELGAQFDANLKQINTLQAINFQLQGKYQLIEQLEKDGQPTPTGSEADPVPSELPGPKE